MILDKTSPLALKKAGVFLSTKIATGITNTAITVLTREITSIFRPWLQKNSEMLQKPVGKSPVKKPSGQSRSNGNKFLGKPQQGFGEAVVKN